MAGSVPLKSVPFKPSYPGCASELDSADLSFCPWSRSRTGAGGLMQHPAGTGHTV